jgi:CHAT domain-containing protein/tetratricopeptide (TPR) repeat protein
MAPRFPIWAGLIGLGCVAFGIPSQISSVRIVRPAQAEELDPLVAEGRRINGLAHARKYEEVIAQTPPLLERIKQQQGENNQMYYIMTLILARAYGGLGRLAEAESLYQRVLEIQEQRYGRESFEVTVALHDLAIADRFLARYAEAESHFKRALAVLEKTGGAGTQDQARIMSNLAVMYSSLGRYADAEATFKRAFAVFEKVLNKYFPNPAKRQDPRAIMFIGDVAGSLNGLASVYIDLGRYADAEPLLMRAIAMRETAQGADSDELHEDLLALGRVYRNLGRNAEAEHLFKRVLAMAEKKLHPDNSTFGSLSYELAKTYRNLGRDAEAEAAGKRAVSSYERSFGPRHPRLADALDALAEVYASTRRYGDAEPLIRRAVEIDEDALGPQHRDVAYLLDRLARIDLASGKVAEALEASRRSTRIAVGFLAGESGGTGFALQSLRPSFDSELEALRRASENGLSDPSAIAEEGFVISQWANQSAASAALSHLAARFAAGSDVLAGLVREQQDAASELRAFDRSLVAELSKAGNERNASREELLRRRIAETSQRLQQLNARVVAGFPGYASLASQQTIKPEEVRMLLAADEALVLLLTGETETQVFAISRDGFDWKAIPLGAKDLSDKVAAFRRGLDVGVIGRMYDKIDQARADKLFDLALAHELYGTLLGPVEALIKDKPHLMVVPSGVLTALPFHLLVTERPTAAVPEQMAGYRDAAWLVKRQAVTVLPSVASLKTLRGFDRKQQANRPMIGFGDPVFDPKEPKVAVAERRARGAGNTRGFSGFWQGTGIDRARLAQLPRLPETADELKIVAQQLGAPPSDIHLRADASETTVKRLPLADYRVVYFATHGLVAGDVEGLAEPSLALTLPARPTAADDGLLTASEVAQLKLNADWVVLSACNTIAGDKPGAEALSGLARAFFYAGARALLVSHWAVESSAATRLTTSTFDLLNTDPKLGRAEALRRAMLAYMNDGADPRRAYPALWAPFVVVGEGAAQ